MKTSDQIDKLAEALSKAQGMFQNPEKNKTAVIPMKSGGSYSFSYADLPETLNVTRKALSECGLSHVSTVSYLDQGVMLLGRLMHSSGQWIESEFLLPNTTDPKVIAGSITYGRRYLFNALIGIAADEDVDAGVVGGVYEAKKNAPKKVIASTPLPQWFMDDLKRNTITELCKSVGLGQKGLFTWISENFGREFKTIEELKTLNEKEYGMVIEGIKLWHLQLIEKRTSEQSQQPKSQ